MPVVGTGVGAARSTACRVLRPRSDRARPAAPGRTGSRSTPRARRRPRSAASSMRCASLASTATGFSHNTCLPASTAAMVCSAWSFTGVHIEMRSRSSRRTNSRQSVDVSSMPSCRPAASTRSGCREHSAATSNSGTARKAGVCTIEPHPTPMIPTLIGSIVPPSGADDARRRALSRDLTVWSNKWFEDSITERPRRSSCASASGVCSTDRWRSFPVSREQAEARGMLANIRVWRRRFAWPGFRLCTRTLPTGPISAASSPTR